MRGVRLYLCRGQDISPESCQNMLVIRLLYQVAVVPKPEAPGSRWARRLRPIVIREREHEIRIPVAVSRVEPAWQGVAQLEMDFCPLVDMACRDSRLSGGRQRRVKGHIAQTIPADP